MRFSLTGDRADAALLVQSIVESTGHSLDVMEIRGDLEARLQSVALPDCRRVSTPEEVLISSDVETVIIAESRAEESIQLARQASQADCHVVVIPPADVSTAWSYELHLLLDESQYGIIVLTGRWYLKYWETPSDQPGEWQLGLPPTVKGPYPESVLMHSIDICTELGFADSRITVLADGDDEAPTVCQVVLSGTDATGKARPSVTLNTTGAVKPLVLSGRTKSETTEMEVVIPELTASLSPEISEMLVDRVASVLPDAAACQRGMEQLSRTLQVMEAVARSTRRRRTIDVYADELTERSVFKTQMTAIGCGVLTWIMLGMVGYLLVAQLFKPPAGVMQVLRALWIAPVALFLIAQLLLPLARGRQQTGSSASSRSESGQETSQND